MKSMLPAYIAWRYLRAKKSHSTVSLIAAVSIAGVAVATAAIVCVLSVFNGFRDVLAGKLDTMSPDIIVTPARGKVFSQTDSLLDAVTRCKDVMIASPTLTDNALAYFDTREMPVTLKGVDFDVFSKITDVKKILLSGGRYPTLSDNGESFEGLVSIGTSIRLDINDDYSNLLLFAPRREGRVNMANPAASFIMDSIAVTGIFQANQSQFDENMVIVPIQLARDIFLYDSEASAIEIKVKPGTDPEKTAGILERMLGPHYVVKDRLQQQDINFRMISIEKWITFLMLFFILAIASFNIISTLSMLVIEKKDSIRTMHSLGMTRRNIGRIFWWESIFVTLTGGFAGIVLGMILCLLQQHFGLIKMNGDPSSLVISVYPVVVKASDIAATLVPIMATGLLTAWISARFAKSRI